jgi:hypothetical protein
MSVLALILAVSAPTCVRGQKASSAKPLTNEDVIDLMEAGLTPEIVAAKIKGSTCKFDTSPTALKRLKATHVPDSVILAMVQASPSDDDTIKTGHVKCQVGATEVVVWLAPGKLTEVASIKCGEKLDILLDGDLWAKIRTQDGKAGYVPRQGVGDWVGSEPSFVPAQPPPPASSSSKRSPLPRQGSGSASPPDVARLGSACSPAIESTIVSDFEGWSGETIFKLDNGQIWEQAEYDYDYDYEYRPDVTIYQTSGGCKMKVEGMNETILVRRIH